MSTEPLFEIDRETERYELRESQPYRFDVDRRHFFKVLGAGVMIIALGATASAQETGGRRRGPRGGQRPADIDAWLHIGEDGTVTIFTGKAEVGQNIRTSLSQAVAEELHVPVSSVRLVMADTDLTPFDAGTFGSRTTPDMAAQLHRVGAAARDALLDLAAQSFQVNRTLLDVADGKVVRTDNHESLAFGELTKGQKLLKTVDDRAPVTPSIQWKIAGTSVPKVDGRAFVTGQHQYTSDMKLPGMLHAKVLRPPAFDATLSFIDTGRAEAMEDVMVVRDGNFVGVAAPDVFTAEQAIDAIHAEWTVKPQQTSSVEIFEHLKKGAPQPQPPGEVPPGERRLQRTYTIAYIAHAPLEPRVALAEWKDGRLTVWTGTQRPFGVRGDLAQAFGLPEDRVRVIVPDTGSAYGGKHTNAAATEAARLAKAAGKPVKVVWTREEEFTWAYFRPAGVIEITSGVREDGTISAWEFHNYNSGRSGIRSPYDIPTQRTELHDPGSPLKQGSYRALASTANTFAREMHMDELAHAVKMDPLEFRYKNLKDARMRGVLEAATKAFGWGKVKAEGRGHGLACGTEKDSYIVMCAEVAADRDKGSLHVVRVVAAFECGAVVNPGHLKNQIEGAIVMGLGGALFEAMEFADGVIKNPRFSNYRVPRFSDAPAIEIVLVDRRDRPSSGAGETPIIGIAPAVGNAIFDATGLRLNSLPMAPNGLKA